jgi:predicted GH43/DUF377 family glycosyl hydrolase
MLTVTRHGVILAQTSLYFENEGVFNPAVFQENGFIHLFYRALNKRKHSSIGYCLLDNPLHIKHRSKFPLINPSRDYESKGMEDPRIVKLDDIYFLSYTAFDGTNALGALALSSNLREFYRWGLIVPLILAPEKAHQGLPVNAVTTENNYHIEIKKNPNVEFIWDKNIVFFPRRIKGKICFFHRIKPCILVVHISNLSDINREFWNTYLQEIHTHSLDCEKLRNTEALYVGAGCPPIEIKDGWLFIYHAVYSINNVLVYKAHCTLLDLNDPQKVLAYLPYALLEPTMDWEKIGNVNNVVFPTGAVLKEDTIFLYYGAADKCIACASFNLKELLKEFTYLKN